jgi:hypothetical protein
VRALTHIWPCSLGYSLIWYNAIAILGTEEQVPRIQEWLTKNKYFLGGAVNREPAC